MSKPPNSQSQKRFSESLASQFGDHATPSCLVLKSSSDVGVMRNGGRNGARFAPQSFISFFKRLSLTEKIKEKYLQEFEVSDQRAEGEDFDAAQRAEAEKIHSILKTHPDSFILHLGGGHDHIYPLLKALQAPKTIVINIDAHADTRTDDEAHSGNPFRKFSEEGNLRIYQIGLHPFANSMSTLAPLKKGHMSSLWRRDLNPENLEKMFMEIRKEITPETKVVLSIDADALSGTIIPGVSAVNGAGLNLEELDLIWEKYAHLKFSHKPILGIYELNPLYDTLSGMSMRTMAGFVFQTLT
jgi:formiminoglutamase